MFLYATYLEIYQIHSDTIIEMSENVNEILVDTFINVNIYNFSFGF